MSAAGGWRNPASDTGAEADDAILGSSMFPSFSHRNLWPRWVWRHFTLAECSGSVGDMGTFLPLALSICQPKLQTGLTFSWVLLWAGVCNVVSGVLFSAPIPVQPMKAIAAAAVTQALSANQITAAGVLTGAIVFVLGITKLITIVNHITPLPLVRGIQLGLGVNVIVKGVQKATQNGWFRWQDVNDTFYSLLIALFIVLSLHAPPSIANRIPVALIVFFGGILYAAVSNPSVAASLPLGMDAPVVYLPSGNDWSVGFTSGTVSQLPLTLLNSVLAVCRLADDLLGSAAVTVVTVGAMSGRDKTVHNHSATALSVSISVGLMNLLGCWFGAMPMCHGAGGLAGQWRYGARSGLAPVVLGVVFIAVALLFGSSISKLLLYFPDSFLYTLLAFAGGELCLAGLKDLDEGLRQYGNGSWANSVRDDRTVVVAVAGMIIVTGNTGIGFATGVVCIACMWVVGGGAYFYYLKYRNRETTQFIQPSESRLVEVPREDERMAGVVGDRAEDVIRVENPMATPMYPAY